MRVLILKLLVRHRNVLRTELTMRRTMRRTRRRPVSHPGSGR